MKRIKFLALAALLAFNSGAYAQFTNTASSTSSSSVNTDGWNSFWIEWNPSTISSDTQGQGGNDSGSSSKSLSFTAFSAGLSRAFSLTQGASLFLEAGGGVQYSFASDFPEKGTDFNMLSVKVPLSLIYLLDIPNSSLSLMPYAGIDLRFNILGKFKYGGGDVSGSDYYSDEYVSGSNSGSVNLFDKKEMGEPWNRFQIGWHVGLKARLGQSFMLGASYGMDFSEICEKTHINTVTVSLGFAF